MDNFDDEECPEYIMSRERYHVYRGGECVLCKKKGRINRQLISLSAGRLEGFAGQVVAALLLCHDGEQIADHEHELRIAVTNLYSACKDFLGKLPIN